MNETIKNIVERGSCNKFKNTHIKKEEIDQIVEAGLNAPSGGNRQTPRLVVIQNDELVKKLSMLNAKVLAKPESDPFYGAPDVVLVLVKKDGTFVCDGSLAMANMLNAAYAMGIGGRWINRAKEIFETEEGKSLLKEWNITEEVEGIGFCILGYPDQEITKKENIPGRVQYID